MGHWGRTGVRAGVAIVALTAMVAAPTSAQTTATKPPQTGTSTSLPLSHADIRTVTEVKDEVRSLQKRMDDARGAEQEARQQVAELAARRTQLMARSRDLSAQEREAARNLQESRAQMRGLALHQYKHGGAIGAADQLLQARTAHELQRQRTILERVNSLRVAAARKFDAAQKAASKELEQVVYDLEDATVKANRAEATAIENGQEADRVGARLEERRRALDLVSSVVPVPGSDIPRAFVDAYRNAAITMARDNPACGIRWSAVAGIGKVESNHGRHGDTRLSSNGSIAPAIVGIKLDGTNGTAVIADTDGGRYDGDAVQDRAVGPMQFIPSTWATVARDGNGDGQTDPNNVYDAALTTAVYLCRGTSTGMATDAGMSAAFLSYNHSDAYAAEVLKHATTYGALRWDPPASPPAP